MLPPRASRPSLLVDNGVVAAWNGAPLGGSAKSLGLIRTDSESTATVTRQHQGSKANWHDGSDTLDRKDKPGRLGDEDGEGPVTTMHVRSEVVGAALAAGADIDEDMKTPVGVKKADLVIPSASVACALGTTAETAVKTPMAMAVPAGVPAPESGCTRVAPITVPPSPAAAAAAQLTPPMGWAPQGPLPGMNLPGPEPLQTLGRSLATKAFTLPPHKLALGMSIMLMVSALLFVAVRARQPAPAAAAPQFPPPVELPQMAFAAPPPALVLPNALAAPKEQAQPQPPTKAERPQPAARRAVPTRATSRTTTIPVHREQ